MIDATTSFLFFGVPLSAVAFAYAAVRLHERSAPPIAKEPLSEDAKNRVTTDELPELIRKVYATLRDVKSDQTQQAEPSSAKP